MSKNFADSLVATAPSPATSGTSLVVTTGEGSKFFLGKAFITPVSTRPSTANSEVVLITAIATDTLTITRAQDGSSARTVIVGDRIFQGPTAARLDGLLNRTAIADAAYTILSTDDIVALTSITVARTFTLPTAVGVAGKRYIIKDESGSVTSSITLTVATTSAQTIDGKTTLVLTYPYDSVTVESDGANWKIISFAKSQYTGSIVQNEVPSGSVNSSNTAFTTASQFATGSLRVYRNGVRLKGSGVDFTENGGLNGFTMTTAPITGDLLLVDYNVWSSTFSVGTNSNITGETPSGTINASNLVFTTARAYIAGTLEVFVDGVRQHGGGNDYTETTPSSGTFTFTTAPANGSVILVNYQFNLNPSSNSDTVDGIHAQPSSSPTASQLVALDSNAKFSSLLLSNPYKFMVYRNAALNTGNGAYAVMTCDTKVYDTGSNVDVVTNKGRFTVPVAGFYVFSGMAAATVAADNGRLLVGILKNGSIYLEGSEPRAGGVTTVLASSFTTPPIQLAINDFIEFATQSDSAAALAVGSPTDNWFGGFLLST